MSHKGAYSGLRFCPKCGVESLEFDRYRPTCDKPEYICKTCGLGFRILESARVQMANQLFKQHRTMRVGKIYEGVSPEVAERWVKFTEEQHLRWQKRVDRRGTSL